MKTRYSVEVWIWNEDSKSYEPDTILISEDRAIAETEYSLLNVCADTPQIELWSETINRYGCVVEVERIFVKY